MSGAIAASTFAVTLLSGAPVMFAASASVDTGMSGMTSNSALLRKRAACAGVNSAETPSMIGNSCVIRPPTRRTAPAAPAAPAAPCASMR